MPCAFRRTKPAVESSLEAFRLRSSSGSASSTSAKPTARPREGLHFRQTSSGNGGNLLFVGTKGAGEGNRPRRQPHPRACRFCVDRWLRAAHLTNYETVTALHREFKKYQQQETSGEIGQARLEEVAASNEKWSACRRISAGIVDMPGLPTAMFVVDVTTKRSPSPRPPGAGHSVCPELQIPTPDPTNSVAPHPGNDDAGKIHSDIVEAIVAAVQSGLSQRDAPPGCNEAPPT